MNKKLLYLDIDGVLLGKRDPNDVEIVLANYAKEFLKLATHYYDCYWLTTHCQDGNVEGAINALKGFCNEELLRLAEMIKPTVWKRSKTEAIDFTSDFYWIEDQPLAFEIEILHKNKSYKRWIKIDTRANPNDLKRAAHVLNMA